MLITRQNKPAIERFMAMVEIDLETQCWNWLGASSNGYGQFKVDGRRKSTRKVGPYRFSWEYFNQKPFPDDMEPDHLCNNRKCCNPEHIEPVTHSENIRRSYQRGRKSPRDYVRAKLTHCKHGHEYTPENRRINSQGHVICRTCDKARCAKYQARLKGLPYLLSI